MRLFVAIAMPEFVIDEIAAWWQGACLHLPAGEWRDLPKQNWHLTLAFFGDVRGRDVDTLLESLALCAGEAKAIRLKLGHSGVFPGEQRARIFWLGVEDAFHTGGLKACVRCCRQAGRATLRKRTAKEGSFRGHITLARRRGFSSPLAAEVLAEIPQSPKVEWMTNRLTLFQSDLCKRGTRYRILEAFEFPGKS